MLMESIMENVGKGIGKGLGKAGAGILKGIFSPVATGVKVGVAGVVLVGGVYYGSKAIKAIKNRGQNKTPDPKKNKGNKP
jgi:hypothetical protein